MPESAPRRSSWGRVLIFVYAIFAIAATGRSSYQLATQASDAPFPYALSAVAAIVYIGATLGLAREGEGWRRVAWAACGTELVGVLVVGTLSVADQELFPDDTVWSAYGAGYGYLPLLLPFAGLAWLWRTRITRA
ncbi:hypothetical protein ISU10_07775 [Nocardioides agariphilus]|uniref:Integral membrane protein n=1 Tax=Nocardioides agariphilus TaxID=433664 RepID=A0A930VN91_9ACTN|nr:hypothetical protein [Nocardioides agariphilus]